MLLRRREGLLFGGWLNSTAELVANPAVATAPAVVMLYRWVLHFVAVTAFG